MIEAAPAAAKWAARSACRVSGFQHASGLSETVDAGVCWDWRRTISHIVSFAPLCLER
jgi:hypothetical protein